MPMPPDQLGTLVIQCPVKPFLTHAETCRLIGVTDKTLNKMIEAGEFPRPVHVDGLKKFSNLAVAAYMLWVQIMREVEPGQQ